MCLVLTVYKVGRVGLHSEIKAIGFASIDGDVCGCFVEITRGLECGVLVNRNADGVVICRMRWRGEDEWRNGERKNTERYPTSETARQ